MPSATIRFSDLFVVEIAFDESDVGPNDVIGKLYYRGEGDEEVLDLVVTTPEDDDNLG